MSAEQHTYEDLPGFESAYLEDSFVLAFDVTPDRVWFRLQVAVLETHPEYRPPPPDLAHYYRRAEMEFPEVRHLDWRPSGVPPTPDLEDPEPDYGFIDFLVYNGDRYMLGGRWGELDVESARPTLRLLPEGDVIDGLTPT